MSDRSEPSLKRHSDDFATGAFPPHGRVELWAEGSVVHIEARGPFNREAVLAVGRAMRDLFADRPVGRVFADILVMRDSLVASPDALVAFEQFLAAMSAADFAPQVVAYVVAPEVEGRSLMLPLFSAIYARHGREFAAFEGMAEAEAWVRERLAARA